jgi:hypothetical protein
MIEQRRQHFFVHSPQRRQGTLGIEGPARRGQGPVVDEGVAGASVEGENLVVRADPGEVGHAAHIEHRQRLGLVARQGGVVERGQWRSLPARRHVGAAKVVDHVDPGAPSEPRPIADLPRAPVLWLVQNRMAVKSDNIDI